MLRTLQVYEDIWWLQDEKMRALITEAMLAGHLSNLKRMTIEGGMHVAFFLYAFQARLEGDSHQATIEELSATRLGPLAEFVGISLLWASLAAPGIAHFQQIAGGKSYLNQRYDT